MLCPNCNAYLPEDAAVCPECGNLVPHTEKKDEGLKAMRQGKRARQAAQQVQDAPLSQRRQGHRRSAARAAQAQPAQGTVPVYTDPDVYDAYGEPVTDTGVDRGSRTLYGDTGTISDPIAPPPRRRNQLNGRVVNMAYVALFASIFVVLLLIGAYAWLKMSTGGQVFLARLGRDASSAAYWQVGESRMDTGDLDGAIADFERAAAQDEEAGQENINVSGLLLLASCYEAMGRTADAEEVYTHIYTDVVPSASEAYTNEIRLMLAEDRKVEASELMRLAYEKTGNRTFSTQLSELLPKQPETTVTAGTKEYTIYLPLTSPEGYDIYYTFDTEAQLPEEGTLYTDPIFLDEGQWRLRAVCVNEDLVSSVLSATYYISMPRPQSPYAHLAPGAYTKRQRVYLSPGVDNRLGKNEKLTKEKDITIYYTIDGSIPDADSPVYDGTAILLGTGNVTLHAIAVNGYGKASNTLEVNYRIDVKPYPKTAYVSQDTCNGIKLNTTGWDEFRKKFGEPTSTETVTLNGIGECRRHHYDWGYVTFTHNGSSQLYVEMLVTSRTTMQGPRTTYVGQTEAEILDKFRDCGQIESPSGNRGLYSNDDGTGKIYKQEDGTYVIRYIAYTADSHYWRLDYNLNLDGVCESIYMLFIP